MLWCGIGVVLIPWRHRTTRETIADPDHRIYMTTERCETAAQTVDVNVKALSIELSRAAPAVPPEFFSSDDAFGIARQPREDQKFFARKPQMMSVAGNIIVVVFHAQATVIINIYFPAGREPYRALR